MRLTEAYWHWLQFTEAHLIFFLGFLKNEFLMMKNLTFTMCLTTFSTKSTKRYTLLKLFSGYLRPRRSPQKVGADRRHASRFNLDPSKKVNSGELCHTKRSGELCPAFSWQTVVRAAPDILYSSRPRHTMMTEVCKANSLKLSYYFIIVLLYYYITVCHLTFH